MKIKEGFILRTVAGETVALPSEGITDLDMMITLNDTGRFLWEQLQTETDIDGLSKALASEYDIDELTAKGAAERFVAKLKELDFLA